MLWYVVIEVLKIIKNLFTSVVIIKSIYIIVYYFIFLMKVIGRFCTAFYVICKYLDSW